MGSQIRPDRRHGGRRKPAMSHLTRRIAFVGAFAGAVALAALPAAAQAPWPNQPIRLIVPEMSKSLGQPIVVENRAGAGGNIGSEACARALPDGHTLCLGTISSHAINPAIYPKMPYDVARDFA